MGSLVCLVNGLEEIKLGLDCGNAYGHRLELAELVASCARIFSECLIKTS